MNSYTYYRGLSSRSIVVEARTLGQADDKLTKQGYDLAKWNLGIAERR